MHTPVLYKEKRRESGSLQLPKDKLQAIHEPIYQQFIIVANVHPAILVLSGNLYPIFLGFILGQKNVFENRSSDFSHAYVSLPR